MDTTIAYALEYSQETLVELKQTIQDTYDGVTIATVDAALNYVKSVRKLMSYSDETCDTRKTALLTAKAVFNSRWDSRVEDALKSQMKAAIATIKEALS